MTSHISRRLFASKSPVYTCKKCGAKHGGVHSKNVCYNSYAKGYR